MELKKYTYRKTIMTDYPFASNDGVLHKTEEDAVRWCLAMNEAQEIDIEDLEAAADLYDKLMSEEK